MMEKKRNKNAIRSVNMLADAYVSLLEELPAERITVTAIVTRAGLNRSTFYAHFGCPEDVHKLLEQRLVDELFESISGLDPKGLIHDPKPILSIVSELIEERKGFVRLMFERHPSAGWLDRIKETVIDKLVSDADSAGLFEDRELLMINIRFFVGGYISMCRDYISDRFDKPVSELTDTLSATIAGGLATGIKE